MKELEIHHTPQIYCPKHIIDLIDVTRCEHCAFFSGVDEKSVKCKYDRSKMLQHMHVTKFWNGVTEYSSKCWNDLSQDEKNYYIEKFNIDKETTIIDTCKFCCFDETLDNGQNICLLRQSAASEEIQAFCCYEDEFWEVSQIYNDEDETETGEE